MNSPKITNEQVLNILDSLYGYSLEGIPGSKSCYELASEYKYIYTDTERACKAFIKNQIAKCTSSGFITNLGGLLTLPISIPVNLSTVWYIQIRMIATIAVMCGYDPSNDVVQTLIYVCLTGTSINTFAKKVGVDITNKLSNQLISKLPKEALYSINKKVGFRLITKYGEHGTITLSKFLPIIGGFVGGAFDYFETRVLAKCALRTFYEHKLD